MKNINLQYDGPFDGMVVSCDRAKIEQVVSNLISNAVKFSNGGSIKIKMRKAQGHVEISVEDEGPGIPPNELPYVFDRFYQGDTGRLRNGSGLGLTIAKIWVEAHGGKIWVESEGEGNGTQVSFSLPL